MTGLRLVILVAAVLIGLAWGATWLEADDAPLVVAGIVGGAATGGGSGRRDDRGDDGKDLLVADSFDDDQLEGWVSYVGGENEPIPSWKVTQGSLEQPHIDGLIRAILTGDANWAHYSLEARVRIVSTQDDSRAGLVFRDDGRGFYVLRIAKGVARAQLMYHCRSPFGWHELATVPLVGLNLAEEWVDLKIECRGPYIRCFVGGSQYIDLADSRAERGRVGFYTCEAHALFDSVKVRRMEPIALPPSRVGNLPYAPPVSFWFRETFTDPSPDAWEVPDGWTLGSAMCYRPAGKGRGGLARLKGAPLADGALQIRMRLLDMPLEELLKKGAESSSGRGEAAATASPVSSAPAAPSPATSAPPASSPAASAPPAPSAAASAPPAPSAAASASPAPSAAPPTRKGRGGVVFRGNGRRYYALLLDRSGQTLSLMYRDDENGSEETLGTATFKEVPEDRWYTLMMEVKGDQMLARIDGIPAIGIRDGRMASGYVGLYCDSGPTVFADLWAASGR